MSKFLEKASGAFGMSFCRPTQTDFGASSTGNHGGFTDEGMWWSRDLEKTSTGHLSFAVFAAQSPCEDQSSIYIGQNSTFVGVHDGHSGNKAAVHANDFFLKRLHELSNGDGSKLSKEMIEGVFRDAEADFVNQVRDSFASNPRIAAAGCSSLVAIIWKDIIYIANLGTSRATIAIAREQSSFMMHLQCTHNSFTPTAALVCRSIGDAALKYPLEFGGENYRATPYLQGDPQIIEVKPNLDREKFIVFATKGLWEFLSNDAAVKIVHENGRSGIAKLLIKSALEIAAARINMTYKAMMKKIKRGKGTNKVLNDDITVIVVYLENETANVGLSVRYGEFGEQRKV